MDTTIDIQEEWQLSRLVDLTKSGNEVVIVDGKTPMARVTAIATSPPEIQPRVAGLHLGVAWVSDDFDEPLPDEYWTGGP